MMEIDQYHIKVKCHRCGTLWILSKNDVGSVDLRKLHDKEAMLKKEDHV